MINFIITTLKVN